jgi:hypothetical protein
MLARLNGSGYAGGYEGKRLTGYEGESFSKVSVVARYGRGLTVPSQVVIVVRLKRTTASAYEQK